MVPTEAFCGECGTASLPQGPAPDASAQEAPATLSPITPSVGAAATPHEGAGDDQDAPDKVAVYAKRVASYAADGVLEPWERDNLEKLRAKLRISHATHDRLIAQYKLKTSSTVRLGLVVDERSFTDFQVGQRGVIRWLIGNRMADEAVHSIRILYGIEGKSGINEHTLQTLRPEGKETFHFHQQLDEAGQFLLAAAIECESDVGDTFHFLTETLPFRVGAAAHAAAALTVNIDASAAKVMQVGDIASATAKTDAGGGIVDGARWREVKLTSVAPADFDQWVRRMEGRNTAAPGGRSSPPGTLRSDSGAPVLAWQGDMGTIKWVGPAPTSGSPGARMLRWLAGATRNELHVIPMATVTFGRDPSRSNVRLAVEPFAPPEVHQENFEKSRRFSGVHCSTTIGASSAEFMHLGSTPSTFVGDALLTGKILLSKIPQEVILGKDAQFPQGSLTVRLRTLPDISGVVAGVLVERRTNVPERMYVQVRGVVSLGANPLRFDATPEEAQVFLSQVEDRPVLVNATTDPVTTNFGVMPRLHGVVLQPGVKVSGAGWEVMVE